MGKTWNADFTKVVPVGTAGNQAQKGIFYKDGIGRIRRLTEAEGHEVSYTICVNLSRTKKTHLRQTFAFGIFADIG